MTQKNQGYAQFCPVAVTAEVICTRWTPLILSAFFCGATKFSEIQKRAPAMSSAILAHRLRELIAANIIAEVASQGKNKQYRLTLAGEALFPILENMGDWAQTWLRRDIVQHKNLDPDILFWEIRQLNVAKQDSIKKRRVAKFLVNGVPSARQCYWLMFEPDNTEICVSDPGHDVDIWITAHITTLVKIWLGHIKLSTALENGDMQLDGSPQEILAFSDWFSLSHFSAKALQELEVAATN
ncbi:MAG: helix-turn-helix transcriptional regulator [Rhizobiales bacterium]|nr:helix-turn-helix transcriptional regulator [Hyphomicrobiales bacterium]NRB13500.1 helix-turn-helix transcriptional regulator [Hyphomicrobiales bacterium]